MSTKCAVFACLAALALVGCGTPLEDVAPKAPAGSVKQAISACDGRYAFTRYWYWEGEETAREFCDCNGNLITEGEPWGAALETDKYGCN